VRRLWFLCPSTQSPMPAVLFGRARASRGQRLRHGTVATCPVNVQQRVAGQQPRSSQPAGVHRCRRHRDARPTIVGPVRRPHVDGGRRPPLTCGNAVRFDLTTSTPPSSTTASPFWSGCGWRRWASAHGAAQRNSRPPVSCPRVDDCPPRCSAASRRRDACIASVICTRPARRSAGPRVRGSWARADGGGRRQRRRPDRGLRAAHR
jgi:hypothetical protein